MLTIFLWLVLVFNGTLAIQFKRDSWLNLAYKLGFTALSILSILLLLQQYGFVVRGS